MVTESERNRWSQSASEDLLASLRRDGYNPDAPPLAARLDRMRFDLDAHGRRGYWVALDGTVDPIGEVKGMVTTGLQPSRKDYAATQRDVRKQAEQREEQEARRQAKMAKLGLS